MGRLKALSEDGLGADMSEVASLTAGRRLAECPQRSLLREEVCGRNGRLSLGHAFGMTARKGEEPLNRGIRAGFGLALLCVGS